MANRAKFRVLVVEDDIISQMAVRSILTELGYDVDIAINGEQALSMFEKGYDIVVSDIGLPDISGLEVSKRMRKKEKNLHTPIIGWASHDGNTVKQECLAAGYDDVILKSIDYSQFKNLLRNCLA